LLLPQHYLDVAAAIAQLQEVNLSHDAPQNNAPGGAHSHGRIRIERNGFVATDVADGLGAVEPLAPRVETESFDPRKLFGAAGGEIVLGRRGHGGSYGLGGHWLILGECGF
jgi:hypothetical protein